MHPDLSAHLHTPECNKLIDAFKLCHEENKYKKWFGACSSLDTQVINCLREERKDKIAENARKAKERQAEILKRSSNLA